jgi:hypothetical protein
MKLYTSPQVFFNRKVGATAVAGGRKTNWTSGSGPEKSFFFLRVAAKFQYVSGRLT